MPVLRLFPRPKWQSEYDLLALDLVDDVSIFLIELDRMEAFPAFIADRDFHRIK